MNLPHGLGRLYNSSHQLLAEGQFQNGQHLSQSTEIDAAGTREEADAVVREEAVVYRADYDEANSAALMATAAAAANTQTPQTQLHSRASSSSSSSFPPLPVPLHLIKPAGPAAILAHIAGGHPGHQTVRLATV